MGEQQELELKSLFNLIHKVNKEKVNIIENGSG